jgi:hypothetical protein
MRVIISTLAIAGIVGCASQHEVAPAPRGAVTNTVAAGTSVPPVSSAAAPKAEAKIKAPAGYKGVERNGQILYCQKTKTTGSNVEREVCMTPTEYAQLKEQADSDRDQFRKNQGNCIGATCGGVH